MYCNLRQRLLAIVFLALLVLASCYGSEVRAEHRTYLPFIQAGATPTLAMSATSWAATPAPTLAAP
ncbi:MAG: hypothetical protein KDE20_17670 [Caldilineaceae bacterium]|nr:hypothetical protein [Caldilineaceae bacterium]